jgi:hypothetical protein
MSQARRVLKAPQVLKDLLDLQVRKELKVSWVLQVQLVQQDRRGLQVHKEARVRLDLRVQRDRLVRKAHKDLPVRTVLRVSKVQQDQPVRPGPMAYSTLRERGCRRSRTPPRQWSPRMVRRT